MFEKNKIIFTTAAQAYSPGQEVWLKIDNDDYYQYKVIRLTKVDLHPEFFGILVNFKWGFLGSRTHEGEPVYFKENIYQMDLEFTGLKRSEIEKGNEEKTKEE